MAYTADGWDGYRYQITAQGSALNGPVVATITKFAAGSAEPAGELAVRADSGSCQPYESAAKAMAAAQKHQDEQVLAWLHPRLREALTAPDLGAMNEARARELAAPSARRVDRTGSVPERVDRLHKALVDLVDAGESLLQCKQAPEITSPSRGAFDQVRDEYTAHAGVHAFTHERVEALDAYLNQMVSVDYSAHPHADRYRDYWEQEYRQARETYVGQRDALRRSLHLAEGEPDVLYMVAAPADADSKLDGRVVVGHSREGYRVGMLPVQDEPLTWSDPVLFRTDADELARHVHRESRAPADEPCALVVGGP